MHGAEAKHQLCDDSLASRGGSLLLGLAAALSIAVSPAQAAGPRLPPIDRDPNRCERAFTGNTIGQACLTLISLDPPPPCLWQQAGWTSHERGTALCSAVAVTISTSALLQYP